MSDLRAAMREFSFLDERRKAGLLSAADEQRWNELREGLGQSEPSPTPEVPAPADSYGYYAADGHWYPYDQQQWAEQQYPGWAWDPEQQQWVPQQGWDQQDPNGCAAWGQHDPAAQAAWEQQDPSAASFDESASDVMEVSADEITLIDEDEVPAAVATVEGDEGPTLVDPDDISEVLEEEASALAEPAAAPEKAESADTNDAFADRWVNAPVQESLSGALLAGLDAESEPPSMPAVAASEEFLLGGAFRAEARPPPSPTAQQFQPSAVFADLVTESESPPVAAAEEIRPGALFGDLVVEEAPPSAGTGAAQVVGIAAEDDGEEPILEALPEEIVDSRAEELTLTSLEQVVSDDELLAEAATPAIPRTEVPELDPAAHAGSWVFRGDGRKGDGAPTSVISPSKEILAVDIELEGNEEEIELTEEVADPEELLASSEDLRAPARIAEVPLTSLQPSWIDGEHRVVVHTDSGQVKRGTIRDADLLEETIALVPPAGHAPERIPIEGVKAIFFMLPTGCQPPALSGTKLRITFKDGRQLAGFAHDYSPRDAGFFVVPADNRTYTARVFVYRASVQSVVEG
jgi:hypothetical protein